jgi:hypothetical protein
MSKEKYVGKLQAAVQINTENLKVLAKPFAVYSKTDPRANGRLGVRRDFRSDDKDMNKAKNAVWELYRDPTCENMYSIHASLLVNSRCGAYYVYEFERVKKRIMDDALPKNESLFERLELVAEGYLRYLENLHECQQKWIEVYENRPNNPEYDEDDYLDILSKIECLQKNIVKFSTDLGECATYLSERGLRVSPSEKSLEASLENLNTSYQAAYQSMSSFWRWIKQLFQRSERNLEIQFLTVLSATEGCTDSIRVRAVELVHNKIMDEYYGSGSRLKDLLGALALKRDSVEMGEENELSTFLNDHPELKMPPELAIHYDAVTPQALTF